MCCIHFADFFKSQNIGERIHTRAAILLGNFDSHKSHFSHFFHRRVRKFSAFIMFGCDWGDFLLGKIARRIADHFVFGCKWVDGKIGHLLSLRKKIVFKIIPLWACKLARCNNRKMAIDFSPSSNIIT